MTAPIGAPARALVVHLGRPQARGEARRVETWQQVLTACGMQVTTLGLLQDHRVRPPRPRASDVPALLRGALVPETQAWSVRSARRALEASDAGVIVHVTARAHHPALLVDGRIHVLDLVDSLARSYADRARIATAFPTGMLLGTLSSAHARFERRVRGQARCVTAGWGDARRLGVHWLPNLVTVEDSLTVTVPDRDLLFFGSLSYEPNVAAVARLGRMWSSVLRRRGATSAIIAGARPAGIVRSLAAQHGWDLVADFPDLRSLCARTRLAIVPLDHTAGIQNKVLEAAALGLPQVVSPAALDGLRPGFPCAVAADDPAFVDQIVALLDDPGARAAQGAAARQHVLDVYSAERWRSLAAELTAP